MSKSSNQNPAPLPVDLLAAIEIVRQQTATPQMIASVTSRAIELSRSSSSTSRDVRPRRIHRLWPMGIAATLFLATSIGIMANRFANHRDRPGRLHGDIIDSPVTKSSLVFVGYHGVNDDLDRADAKVELLSESLEMAALQREIQVTLDEFYDWSATE